MRPLGLGGYEGGALCGRSASGVMRGAGPQTSPSGQGLDAAGAHHSPPGREGRGASGAQKTSPRLQHLSLGWGKSHRKSERRRLLLPAHRHQSRATETSNREP